MFPAVSYCSDFGISLYGATHARIPLPYSWPMQVVLDLLNLKDPQTGAGRGPRHRDTRVSLLWWPTSPAHDDALHPTAGHLGGAYYSPTHPHLHLDHLCPCIRGRGCTSGSDCQPECTSGCNVTCSATLQCSGTASTTSCFKFRVCSRTSESTYEATSSQSSCVASVGILRVHLETQVHPCVCVLCLCYRAQPFHHHWHDVSMVFNHHWQVPQEYIMQAGRRRAGVA